VRVHVPIPAAALIVATLLARASASVADAQICDRAGESETGHDPIAEVADCIDPEPGEWLIPVATATAVPRPTMQQLRNAEYSLPFFGVSRRVFRLVDGAVMLPGREGLLRLLENDVIYGDLNGDGREDAVVVLVFDPGGSGHFLYAVLLLNDDAAPRQVDVELLGDRIRIGRIDIFKGEATVIYLTQRPTDAMCCPTRWTSKVLRPPRPGQSASPDIH
jgi:hypothetical protein